MKYSINKNILAKSGLKVLLLGAVFTIVSACTAVPNEINVADAERLIPFEAVAQASTESTASAGKKARWGGKIVAVENKKDVSEIEVVFFPANRFGRPQLNMESAGRFKAVVDGFIDPLVFEEGRIITVVGEIADKQSGIIGEQVYEYATLDAKGYYLWKETTNVQVDTFAFSPFFYSARYHRGFFNPWYDPWHHRFHRTNVRYRKHNGHSQGGFSNRSNRSNASSTNNTQVRRNNSTTGGEQRHSIDKMK